MNASADPHKYERSIQAFYSAFYTLGDHTFATNTITMDEVQADQQIQLDDIRVNFDTYAIYFSSPTGLAPTKGSQCTPYLIPETMKQPLTIGVSKDPKTLTYYAVKLKARAKLLFNPWGSDGIELKAYAAAQPFGSRIGPALTIDSWVRKNAKANIPISNASSTGAPPMKPLEQVPNLPISEGDTLDLGWNTTEVLGTLVNAAFPVANNGVHTITESDLARGYQLAMAPNPYEGKFYNIPNDLATDQGHYDPSHKFSPGIFDDSRAAILWAPVAPPDNPGGVDGEIQSDITDLFSNAGPDAAALKSTLKAQIGKYINDIKSQDLSACGKAKLAQNLDDSDCESFNMVRITNPLKPRPVASGANTSGLLNLPDWFMPHKAEEVLTSWNHPNDPPMPGDPGRMGYSVKFVAFDALINRRLPTDSATQTKFDNPPGTGDDEALYDMKAIEH
jgi:hypothetical protein